MALFSCLQPCSYQLLWFSGHGAAALLTQRFALPGHVVLIGVLLVIRLALHGLARYLLPIQYQFPVMHAAVVWSP